MEESFAARVVQGAERATDWLARIGAVLLVALMVLTFCDVVGRFFGQPIVGTVEVTELMMALIIFLGIGATTMAKGHIRVDVLIIYLPSRAQAALEIVTMIFSIFFSTLVSWQLWLKAADIRMTGDLTQVWELPVWPVAYVMAFGSLPLVAALVLHLVRAVAVFLSPQSGR